MRVARCALGGVSRAAWGREQQLESEREHGHGREGEVTEVEVLEAAEPHACGDQGMRLEALKPPLTCNGVYSTLQPGRTRTRIRARSAESLSPFEPFVSPFYVAASSRCGIHACYDACSVCYMRSLGIYHLLSFVILVISRSSFLNVCASL